MVEGAYLSPGGRLPVTALTCFGSTTTGLSGARQCGRAGFAPIWIQRAKSRASLRVASRQATSTAQRNRNQRNNAIPYERWVVAARPAACNSPKYAATAVTGSPEESSSRYGSQGSPVAAREPARGTTSDRRFRDGDDRDRRRSERRIKAAGFPRQKWLTDFDFDANPNISSAMVNNLATCGWVRNGEPLCLIGDSGTGKSHLLIGLGAAAVMAGFRVRYVLAAKLVNELVEAADDKILNKTIARYGRVDLLCIDELGYMELDRHGAELLFQVLTEREETNSVAIASNESFAGWTKTFTDPRLCAAIVDRLTFGGNIIDTGTESCRLLHAHQKTLATAQTDPLP